MFSQNVLDFFTKYLLGKDDNRAKSIAILKSNPEGVKKYLTENMMDIVSVACLHTREMILVDDPEAAAKEIVDHLMKVSS